MRRRPDLILMALAGLAGCAGTADEPTLKSLEDRPQTSFPERLINKGIGPNDQEKAIAAYRAFAKSAQADARRPEALRRLGDLQLESADNPEVAEKAGKKASGAGDYRGAIALYQDLLKAYPKFAGNDRVLYQLGRAYEQSGDLNNALKVLDRLVTEYPHTPYREEVQFRRGETLFTAKSYAAAERAYEDVLKGGANSPYYERALYMHGWTRFKQIRYEDGLQSFFTLLDRKLIGRVHPLVDTDLPAMDRAEREIAEDTMRAVSLSFSALQGAESIPAFSTPERRRTYEHLVYSSLAATYQKQERVKDAADTYAAFSARYPTHPQAPRMQARVIDTYQQAGFGNLAIVAKKDFVTRYGITSAYHQANPQYYDQVVPLLKSNLKDLARHYHSTAQKKHESADYQEAARWYREFLKSFPNDGEAAGMNFLLAEMLYEDKHYAEAAIEYEMTAYHYPRHAKSADAGYAALLAFAEQEKRASAAERKTVQLAAIDSAMRFAAANPKDARLGSVLTANAEKLYSMHDPDRAAVVARQALTLVPPASTAQRRAAWTVIAHTEFERGAFDRAEQGYREVLALMPEKDAGRGKLTERLAAAIYKQGEQARSSGNMREAVAHFGRVGEAAPLSPIRANAQYDAAAALIALKDWNGASQVLEDFRSRYPNHALKGEIGGKLAVVYIESGRWSLAAGELEKLAAEKKEPQLAREALWQAAELYEKAGKRDAAVKMYERYVKQNPEPLESAIEGRYRLAQIAKKDGNGVRERSWMKEIFEADRNGGRGRTDRTRFLGATAALMLADPVYEEYRKVALVEPLKKQLKLKKAKMEDALKAYTVAAEYGVADVATASTYRIAELYGDFGGALLGSQRPKGLSKDELEQYNVMLEEQAYPFEERAIELHEVNARRGADGIYDAWVKNSYSALGKLRPVRYAKSERSEVVIDALR
jgi:cellulose synthase operon protein C